MGQRTPLYQLHVDAGAKMVDFGGWEMPIHYGSQLDEHHAVRRDAGMFDVSHMRIADLSGGQVREFLRLVLANNVDKLKDAGKAFYSCMLNAEGGVIDDLIVYHLAPDRYRLVVNAGTADKDMAWLEQHARESGAVQIRPRKDLAMIAVQGPEARGKVVRVLADIVAPDEVEDVRAAASGLKRFYGTERAGLFIARTGYTGEDGFEIAMDGGRCAEVWRVLGAAGVAPCGLGARDTLRLEAGMNLYGADMDETTTPLESGLAWTVGWEPDDRVFIGRAALEKQRSVGPSRKLVGLVLLDRGVLRGGQKVICGEHGDGKITSGTFSPTLARSIAFARVPSAVRVGDACEVEIRAKRLRAEVVEYPFVRNGRSCL